MDTFIKDVKNFDEFKTWILKNIRQDTFLSYEGAKNIFYYMSIIEKQQSQEALDALKKCMTSTASDSTSNKDNISATTAYASSLNIDPIVFTGVLTGFSFSGDFPQSMTWEQLLNSPRAMTQIYDFFCDYWENSKDNIMLWQNSDDCLGCPLSDICSKWYDDDRIVNLIASMQILREEGYIALKSET